MTKQTIILRAPDSVTLYEAVNTYINQDKDSKNILDIQYSSCYNTDKNEYHYSVLIVYEPINKDIIILESGLRTQ